MVVIVLCQSDRGRFESLSNRLWKISKSKMSLLSELAVLRKGLGENLYTLSRRLTIFPLLNACSATASKFSEGIK